MRTRATVAAVSGALALSAFAVPTAQAAPSSGVPHTLNASFSSVKIAKAIKVGTTYEVSRKYTFTLTHDAEVDITAKDFFADAYLYRGSFDDPTAELDGDSPATCTATSTTTATCAGTVDIYPADGDLKNAWAGTWHVAAEVIAFNGQDQTDPDLSKVGFKDQSGLASTRVQRYSKLTANAGPEPVVKGKTLTVKGKLSRANWEDRKYHGYTKQPVKLQFRKKGSSTYTTVKTVYTNSYGNLKTTTTAKYDGYWRFYFAGTTTTPAVKAKGDYVDVK
ncbi:hypothetical protein LK07_19625 [Streptomyces pluripotens]|uniref:Calcium-binding protein n=1 Tax=Streptomyces pluripotens TaxID=1355015 RepID=A0A221P0W4_9ACTN|nr:MULTISPECIES: hypothetical protein [Streptomyces]ARP71598.1 hypothetical protein LK06_018465 [Streptomyces pluripotens]ASN25850.1 hypothetical protein LK07_19625 [Streptomyces pluripotens]KIE27492.1 lipoprotein [Streptomyces sp. MUSC 125]MCH0557524.1 hypothetical protein [Streptomyces sp. MUM 16J]